MYRHPIWGTWPPNLSARFPATHLAREGAGPAISENVDSRARRGRVLRPPGSSTNLRWRFGARSPWMTELRFCEVRRWIAPVGAAVLSWGVVSAAVGCGLQPSASDLWGRPLDSGVRNAHATVTASGGARGERLQGDGTVVFKPRTAMSLRLQTRLGMVGGELDVLEVGGVTYQRAAA